MDKENRTSESSESVIYMGGNPAIKLESAGQEKGSERDSDDGTTPKIDTANPMLFGSDCITKLYALPERLDLNLKGNLDEATKTRYQ